MKVTRKILILLFLSFVSTGLFAAPFQEIIILGDSLSDNGNLYQAIKIVPKSPPYYLGRFSNGPTWAETLGKHYYDKYSIDYKNYSYGGATAVIHDVFQDSFLSPMTMDGEMSLYTKDASQKNIDKSKVLYVIWIGANDYLYDRSPDINLLTGRVVAKTVAIMNQLIGLGGKHFLVLNLPDLSRAPYGRENNLVDRLHNISMMHNQKLAAEMAGFVSRYPSMQFVSVNVQDIFDELLKNPEKFNQQFGKHITNLTDPCWTGGWFDTLTDSSGVNAEWKSRLNGILNSSDWKHAEKNSKDAPTRCANPNEYVFWDILHPTAAVHDILGGIVIQNLTDVGVG